MSAIQPWDVCVRLTPGRQVVITARGSYRGMRGEVAECRSPADSPDNEGITGNCRYTIHVNGIYNQDGTPKNIDFRRREFRVIALEHRADRRARRVASGAA